MKCCRVDVFFLRLGQLFVFLKWEQNNLQVWVHDRPAAFGSVISERLWTKFCGFWPGSRRSCLVFVQTSWCLLSCCVFPNHSCSWTFMWRNTVTETRFLGRNGSSTRLPPSPFPEPHMLWKYMCVASNMKSLSLQILPKIPEFHKLSALIWDDG